MKCLKCNLALIENEKHACRKAKGFHIEGNILWISDGVTKYPLKLDQIQKDIRTGKINIKISRASYNNTRH